MKNALRDLEEAIRLACKNARLLKPEEKASELITKIVDEHPVYILEIIDDIKAVIEYDNSKNIVMVNLIDPELVSKKTSINHHMYSYLLAFQALYFFQLGGAKHYEPLDVKCITHGGFKMEIKVNDLCDIAAIISSLYVALTVDSLKKE